MTLVRVIRSLAAAAALSLCGCSNAVHADSLQQRIDMVQARDPALALVLSRYAQALRALAATQSPSQASAAQRQLDAANACGRALAGAAPFALERQALHQLLFADPQQRTGYEHAQTLLSAAAAATAADPARCDHPSPAPAKTLPPAWRGCAVATRYTVSGVRTLTDANLAVVGRFELDGHEDIAFVLASKESGAAPALGTQRCSATD